MKEAFMKFVNAGVTMTCDELAKIVGYSPDFVRRHSQPPHGFIPRIPPGKPIRFDPTRMIEVFCTPQIEPPAPSRSLKTERRKISENQKGGFRKCL